MNRAKAAGDNEVVQRATCHQKGQYELQGMVEKGYHMGGRCQEALYLVYRPQIWLFHLSRLKSTSQDLPTCIFLEMSFVVPLNPRTPPQCYPETQIGWHLQWTAGPVLLTLCCRWRWHLGVPPHRRTV